MSKLKPIKWDKKNRAYSATHWYAILNDVESKNAKAVVYKRISSDGCMKKATGFKSVEEAKEWCWQHYNIKMSPYLT